MSVALIQRNDSVYLEIVRRYKVEAREIFLNHDMQIHINGIHRFTLPLIHVADVICIPSRAEGVCTINYSVKIENPALLKILIDERFGRSATASLFEPSPGTYGLKIVPVIAYQPHPLEVPNEFRYCYWNRGQSPSWDHELPLETLLETNTLAYVNNGTPTDKVILGDGTELKCTAAGWEYHSDISLKLPTLEGLKVYTPKEAMHLVLLDCERIANVI